MRLAMVGDDAIAESADRRGRRPGAGELPQLDLAGGAERGAIDELLVGGQRRWGCRCGRGGLLRAGGEGEQSECGQGEPGWRARHGHLHIYREALAKHDRTFLVSPLLRDPAVAPAAVAQW